jgi:hypothetical protein
MKHGGSLTINPDTGLPEAGFLKSLLPMLAGFALAPLTAGTSLAFLGASPFAAAMTVGGVTGLATGSLKKGLLAGLGAYGGAGLQAGLAGAGANSLTTAGVGDYASSLAEQGIFPTLESGAVNTAFGEGASKIALEAQRQALATPTSELLSAGAKASAADPMGFAKQNLMPLAAAAAAPIMAMEPITQMPGNPSGPAYIRQKVWNGRGYDEVGPVEASKFGGNSFSDIYRGYNGGGIVALANGGIPGFAGNEFSFVKDASGMAQADINAALAAELSARGGSSLADIKEYAKTGYKLSDAQINAALDTIPGFNAQGQWDANDYMANDKPGVDYQLQVDAANAANPFSAQNMANVDVTRPGHYVTDPTTGKPVALTYYSPGFDINNPTALTYLGELSAKGAGDTASQWFNQNATAAQKAEAARLWKIEEDRLRALDVAAGRIPASGADTKAPTGLAQLDTTTKAPTGLAQINTTTKLANNAAVGTTAPPAGETPAARDARLFQAAGGSWTKAAELRAKEDNAANAAKWQAEADRIAAGNKALVADPNYWLSKTGIAALQALPEGTSETTKWYAQRDLGFDPIDAVIDNFLIKYKPELAAMLPKEQEAAMRAALDKEKLNEADVIKATGKTIAQLAAAKRADGSIIVPGNLKDVPVGSLPGGVSGGGDTQINANGTITTKPDFGLTMNEVRDTYTKGGGSLGYTSPTFASLKAVEDKYPLRGAAKQSYDYLMGREDYSPIPYTKDGQVSKSYAESVMKLPRASASKMYIFQNGKFVPNPEYAIPTYDKDGKKSLNLTNADVKAYMDKKPSASDFYTWATTNNLSPEQIALASERPINEISKLFTGAKALTGDDGKIDQTKVDDKAAADEREYFDEAAYLAAYPDVKREIETGKSASGQPSQFKTGYEHYLKFGKGSTTHLPKFKPGYTPPVVKARGGSVMGYAMGGYAVGGGLGNLGSLGSYSDGGRLLKGPGDGVSDSIPATIGAKQQPARLADGEFVVPARIVSELGNGSTDAGAKKLYAMMDRVQRARGKTTGKNKVAANSRADKYLPA